MASRATKCETKGDYDEAFQSYISSVQTYLYLIRNVPDGSLRISLKEMSTKLLNRAEQIKSHRRHIKAAVRDRVSLGTRPGIERIGKNQWPIISPVDLLSFKRSQYEPPLNPAQKNIFLRWVSISDLYPNSILYKPGEPDPTDIVQDVVTDCSLIASYATGRMKHTQTDGSLSQLNVACLYPKDYSGNPEATTSGIYRVKLFLNGTYREIPVDDKIPTGIERPMMCAQCRGGDFFWPALIEKAYMKVMAGYDFVGSNSSVDLHALTGWIPETIFTTSGEYRGEKSWRRALAGFKKGHCLVTVGTNGNISDALDSVGLIPHHNYAILDMDEDDTGRRRVKLYNAWNARPDEKSTSWTSELKDALPGIEPSQQKELVGTFTISWEALQIYFDTIYMNWDPKIFEYQQTVHFSNAPVPAFTFRFGPVPQSQAEAEVWVLLTRHLSDQPSDCENYMSFSVFHDENDDELIEGTDYVPQPVISTPLSNAIHVLTRFVPSSHQAAYTINFSFHCPRTPAQRSNNPQKPSGYTLSIYSSSPCCLQDAGPVTLPYTAEVEGKWTTRTSGGNHSLTTFMNNPMWRVTIGEAKDRTKLTSKKTLRATLFACDEAGDVDSGKALNLKLVRADGDGRVYDVERRDLVADSGSYTRGRAQLRTKGILPGTYTIVPSTFSAGVQGSFKLSVECELPLITTTPIPLEGSGMYKRTCSATWEEERQSQTPGWKVFGGKGDVEIKFRVQATTNPGLYPVKLCLYRTSLGQDSRQVVASGTLTLALSGAALGPLQLTFVDEVTYTICVEAVGDPCLTTGSGYSLIAYADQPLTLSRRYRVARLDHTVLSCNTSVLLNVLQHYPLDGSSLRNPLAFVPLVVVEDSGLDAHFSSDDSLHTNCKPHSALGILCESESKRILYEPVTSCSNIQQVCAYT
ncbi:calpain-like protease palB/RIM13 [Melampsora larici-populina 98AG31]|uniref:Calpain-like protease palB/RIM13 n=1 Tax=Melampsora larici-populina (strain 98AG31 / pathotype 3-4-7) TaxID=747676 RepID=F4RUY7_MELLP|nr:calpain-like protease palB/RIM13 [Melampsora larici-populina 98AG31]EGG03841.1 calpain-like protease palB/RIM13 [Melampsora larici-populina 98AG31]